MAVRRANASGFGSGGRQYLLCGSTPRLAARTMARYVMLGRLFNVFCAACLCLSVAAAALWAWSHRRGGSVYFARGGVAAAVEWGPGEMSLWLGGIDRRCRLNPIADARPAAKSPSAIAWVERDPGARAAAWGRLAYARCSSFPDVFPKRLLRGAVTGFVAPLWFLVALTAAVPLARLAGAVRRRVEVRRRRRHGGCVGCGYDLRSSGSTCPECGEEQKLSPPPPWRTRRRALALVGTFALTGCIGQLLYFTRNQPHVPKARVSGKDAPAWWLDRATVSARAMRSSVDRSNAYERIVGLHLLLRDRDAAGQVVRVWEAEERVNRRSSGADVEHTRFLPIFALLGDEQAFRRHALRAERLAEDSQWYEWSKSSIAAAYAWHGDFEAVAAIVNSITDSKDRTSALAELATNELVPDFRALVGAVSVLLRGEAERATYWGDRSFALYLLAELQIRQGDLATAAETARAIPGLHYRANLLEKLATAHAKRGDDAAARAAREQADATRPPPMAKPEVLAGRHVEDAERLFRRGDRAGMVRALAASEAVIPTIADARERVGAWTYLASVHAKAGDLEECRRVLRQVGTVPLHGGDDTRGPEPQIHGHGESLVAALAAAGDLPWALRLVESLPDHFRANDHGLIINSLCARGDVEAAKRVSAKTASGPERRRGDAYSIARAQARREGPSALPEWVESLLTPEERTWALIGAADGLRSTSIDDDDD